MAAVADRLGSMYDATSDGDEVDLVTFGLDSDDDDGRVHLS